jgi:hypothetical protein
MLMAFRSDFSETLPLHWVMEPTVGASGEVSMDNEVFIDLNINQPLQG